MDINSFSALLQININFSSPPPISFTLQVVEWLTFAITELTPLLDDKLAKVNDWLASRSFLVGNDVTLADLVVYATAAPAVVSRINSFLWPPLNKFTITI